MSTRTHTRGEQGIAVIMTALVLLPLMVFAAFGVDLASWYSRVSYLQKAADAASLAGTVWMPDINKATAEAKTSLRSNGVVDKDEGGTDDLDVVIEQGSTVTSLKVVVTDNSATRYFSQMFKGNQALTRSAEAEYNLPIPLGSPLNYFGGDASKTESNTVTFPTNYATAPPVNYTCNIGANAGQNLGRWLSNGTWDPSGHNSSGVLCVWGATGQQNTGSRSTVPPPDYGTRVPIDGQGGNGERPCNVFGVAPPSTTPGRWTTTNSGTYENSQYTSGSNNRACTWFAMQTQGLPGYATTVRPQNGPCNIGYADVNGRWTAGGTFEAARYVQTSALGNRLCRWGLEYAITNPIAQNRNPRFWAAIGGPGDVSAFGDGFSARCTGNTNCSGDPNEMYTGDGYWYVIKMPLSGSTSTSVRVFDAAYNEDATNQTLTGDFRGTFSSGNGFTTSYRIYRQTNPLDFSSKTPLGPNTGNQTAGSCHWSLRAQTEFRVRWTELCSITPSDGEVYLLNVKTSGSSGSTDGVNGYAVEAIASGAVQPAVYAFGSMAMRNNIANNIADFYLAEVGPQYAGKTLVIELFDAGDASGNAYLQPVMPGTVAGSFSNIPAERCSYTASPAPNPGIRTGSPAGGQTSPAVPNATATGTNCRIQTTSGGAQQFNDEWLEIRVTLPATYSCTLGVNPEVDTGSCWWGILYDFSLGNANDVTTWRARIEGNPVHLTQ